MRNRLRSFMAARNGFDQLGLALTAGALFLSLLGQVIRRSLPEFLGMVLLVWALYRMFSRNLARRQAENLWFLGRVRRLKSGVQGWFIRLRQSREYRFFQCPGCKNRLRVPRGKGRIHITCPRCGHRFSGKT